MTAAVATTLVEPVVSRCKLARELEQWHANSAHRKRGCILLRADIEALVVEIAFSTRISLSAGSAPLPVIVCAIRLSYDNYDLWPPSLTFIDLFSGEPVMPSVRAVDWNGSEPQNYLIDAHPTTGLPFLCFPGVREYHNHPQHTGDDWLLHRQSAEGNLTTISDRVWRFMARNVVGLNVQLQALPVFPLQAQISLALAQGNFQNRSKEMPHPHEGAVSSEAHDERAK